jgi:hypothetical protein
MKKVFGFIKRFWYIPVILGGLIVGWILYKRYTAKSPIVV